MAVRWLRLIQKQENWALLIYLSVCLPSGDKINSLLVRWSIQFQIFIGRNFCHKTLPIPMELLNIKYGFTIKSKVLFSTEVTKFLQNFTDDCRNKKNKSSILKETTIFMENFSLHNFWIHFYQLNLKFAVNSEAKNAKNFLCHFANRDPRIP